ncbi:hypothetical protein ACFFX0_12835 [Citricoccus parietis]|uniref:Secreted protein n=1 Tax=Citricoccus parietis TaxID=592307 RepID=A0ABV5FZE1_9MICC
MRAWRRIWRISATRCPSSISRPGTVYLAWVSLALLFFAAIVTPFVRRRLSVLHCAAVSIPSLKHPGSLPARQRSLTFVNVTYSEQARSRP